MLNVENNDEDQIESQPLTNNDAYPATHDKHCYAS